LFSGKESGRRLGYGGNLPGDTEFRNGNLNAARAGDRI